jgi:predicted ArsR family transcriptional regulator
VRETDDVARRSEGQGDRPEQDAVVAPRWTFLTNHAHVLLAIAGDPSVRMRDVAARVGVTERAVQMIVADLVADGYLVRSRVGRRNHYVVNRAGPFRHPAESHHRVGELLELFERDG